MTDRDAVDRAFMAQALDLGARNLGRTWPNPSVGAIVTQDSPDGPVVVARGLTQAGGRPHGEALAFVRQVDSWLASCDSPEIGELVATTGLSRRQVERKCNALYGAPPKLLARKYRALRAAVALASGASSTDDVVDRGFYDQSHMIREIKQFTGLTPRQIKADPPLLSRLTIAQRHALGGQVNPLISDT